MKYYLWVRWSPECKEAFEITENAANWIKNEWHNGRWSENKWFHFTTPTSRKIKLKLNKALAFKVVTKEFNPLEDESFYDNPCD
jgi:hypothetical protein